MGPFSCTTEYARVLAFKPYTSTYNSLLGDALVCRVVDRAWRMLGLKENSVLGRDAYTMSILFKGYEGIAKPWLPGASAKPLPYSTSAL